MARLRLSALAPPPAGGDPRDTLRWVRRMELVGAVFCFAAAVMIGDPAWARWVLVALGVLGLSPWPGAAALLRKANNNAPVLVSDPEHRKARARRAMRITAAGEVALVFLVGLVVGGLSVAIVTGLLGLAGALLGVWLTGRWLRSDVS
jgi:hypothetical protein